ncbi:hypothetical protein CAEBREN_25225 [Caenorhabditis brenneri]|uniref:Uncharacterized protein n=1 Tax=Caenorhabditis brenneri TaxID=135651 RepID=G0P5S1_CAEBE|nr:hypothetical protein CAEBREN_25225 [Caenorhabditis brenneri]
MVPLATPPEFKPRKYAASNELLTFIKSAYEPKADIVNVLSEYYKKSIENLQKDRVVRTEEMNELFDMGMELSQHRFYYRNTVNYLITKVFAEKIRFLVILLTLLATGIGWLMFYHHNKALPDSEYIFLSLLVMATAYFIVLQIMRIPFFSLKLEDFFKDDPKSIKEEVIENPRYTHKDLITEQQGLWDSFLKDVYPVKTKAESLNNWRFVLEMIGTAVGYSYISICLYFFIIRCRASESGSHEAQLNGSLIVSTVVFAIILIPTLLM